MTTTKPKPYYPHLDQRGRTMGHDEKGLYLDKILPTVYAEMYMLTVDEKQQVLHALRQELTYWSGLDNHQIESRMVGR